VYKIPSGPQGLTRSRTNLGDTEVGEQKAPGTSRTPDEEHLDLETGGAGLFIDQVGGSVADTEVPEPVGGDREGHGFGTDVEREDLTGDDPSDGSPCGGEEGDVDADEGDQNLLSGDVGGRDSDANDGDHEFANAHSDGTDQEQPPTTESFDTPHAGESHEHVDDINGNGDQEGAGNTGVLEEDGTVVENEVDTGELLPALNEDTGEGAEADFVVGCAETVKVRRLAQLLLLLVGSANLFEFGPELRMIGREGDETGEGMGSIFVALLLDEPPGGLREEDHTDSEDEAPDELEGDGDLPRCTSDHVLGAVVDDGGDEKTDGDCPLVTGDDGTTVLIVGVSDGGAMTEMASQKMKENLPDPLRGTLGLVHGDQHGNHSDTPTGENTTHDEERNGRGSGLHCDSGPEDDDGKDDRPPPTEEICGGGGKEGTEEGTSRQYGDDEGLLG